MLALAKTYGCTIDRLEAIVWLVQVQRTLFYGKQQKRNGVDLGDTWFEIPSDLSGKHSQHIFAQWLWLAQKVVHVRFDWSRRNRCVLKLQCQLVKEQPIS